VIFTGQYLSTWMTSG